MGKETEVYPNVPWATKAFNFSGGFSTESVGTSCPISFPIIAE
jgi:hypothetical protein